MGAVFVEASQRTTYTPYGVRRQTPAVALPLLVLVDAGGHALLVLVDEGVMGAVFVCRSQRHIRRTQVDSGCSPALVVLVDTTIGVTGAVFAETNDIYSVWSTQTASGHGPVLPCLTFASASRTDPPSLHPKSTSPHKGQRFIGPHSQHPHNLVQVQWPRCERAGSNVRPSSSNPGRS